MKYVFAFVCLMCAQSMSAQIPAEFRLIEQWADSICLIEKNGKLGLYNEEIQEPLVLPKYDKINHFGLIREGWAIVQLKEKIGIIDLSGFEVSEPVYDEIFPFGEKHQNWALVKRKGKYGFIEIEMGYEIVHPIYDEIGLFGEPGQGLALVKKDNLYGIIDDFGVEIISCRFEMLEPFGRIHPTLAKVRRKGKYGLIDIEGIEMIPCIYDTLEKHGDASYKCTRDNKSVYVDETGAEFTPD